MGWFKYKWIDYLIFGLGFTAMIILLETHVYQSEVVEMRNMGRGSRGAFSIILHVIDKYLGKTGVYLVLGSISSLFYWDAYKAFKTKELNQKDNSK